MSIDDKHSGRFIEASPDGVRTGTVVVGECGCGTVHLFLLGDDGRAFAVGHVTYEQLPSFLALVCKAAGATCNLTNVTEAPPESTRPH